MPRSCCRVGVWMTDIEGNGYQGPPRVVPTNVVNIRELELIENFEGQSAWAIGLDQQRGFTVSTLTDPVRIVIDIALAPGGAPAPTTTRARQRAPADPLTTASVDSHVQCVPGHAGRGWPLLGWRLVARITSDSGDEVDPARAHPEDAEEEVHQRADRQREHGGADAD